MRRSFASSLLCLTVVSGVLSAQTTFNAVGGQINNGANWTNGLPSLANPGTIAINVNLNSGPTDAIIFHTAGTATSNSNRTFANTTWNLQGGTVNFGANWNSGTGGFVLNISAGSFTALTLQLTNASTLNLSGGTVSVSNTASNTGTVIDISGGSLTTTGTFSVGSGTLNLTGGSVNVGGQFTATAALITFGLGDASLTAASITTSGATVIDFQSGTQGQLTITGFTAANYESLWNSNNLRIDGARPGEFGDWFAVNGSTLTAIPEPATVAALMGLGALGALTLRRRR